MQVWTFIITGGQVFSLTLPNMPPLDHDGKKTVWKMVGDNVKALALQNAIIALGATAYCTTEVESIEQVQERTALLTGTWIDELTMDIQIHPATITKH